MRPNKRQRVEGIAAATSSASSAPSGALPAAAAATALPPQPHLMLHRHALERTLSFLSFDELRSALLVLQRSAGWKLWAPCATQLAEC